MSQAYKVYQWLFEGGSTPNCAYANPSAPTETFPRRPDLGLGETQLNRRAGVVVFARIT